MFKPGDKVRITNVDPLSEASKHYIYKVGEVYTLSSCYTGWTDSERLVWRVKENKDSRVLLYESEFELVTKESKKPADKNIGWGIE